MHCKWAVVIYCLATFCVVAAEQTPTDEKTSARKFGRAVAGAYFLQFDAGALEELLPKSLFLPAITTIHADGTILALDGTDNRLGGRLGLSMNTRSQGNWHRLDRRTIVANTLYFNFLSDQGEISAHSGVLDGITRLSIVFRFDDGYESGTGVACRQLQNVVHSGVYNPITDHPLERLPKVECNESYADALPFTFWMIR